MNQVFESALSTKKILNFCRDDFEYTESVSIRLDKYNSVNSSVDLYRFRNEMLACDLRK